MVADVVGVAVNGLAEETLFDNVVNVLLTTIVVAVLGFDETPTDPLELLLSGDSEPGTLEGPVDCVKFTVYGVLVLKMVLKFVVICLVDTEIFGELDVAFSVNGDVVTDVAAAVGPELCVAVKEPFDVETVVFIPCDSFEVK